MNYYQKNIDIINKLNKNFVERLEEKKEDPNIILLDKKNFLVKQGAKEFLAYPKEKEYKTIDEKLKGKKVYNGDVSIQIGIGNGYHLYKLLKEKAEEKHVLFLIETNTFLLKEAFKHYDFSNYIEKGNLTLCIDPAEIKVILSVIQNSKVVNQWHLFIEDYTHHIEDYKEIIKQVSETINQIMCEVGTVMGAGPIIAENDIKNLPYIIKHRGVEELKNLYKNKPAIVILSAPTVTRLLPQLLDKKIRNRIIIIAIAQMLRPLLAFGIRPDFICTVDYGEVNYEHFDNLWNVKDIPLVMLNRSYAPIIENWQGPKFVVVGQQAILENKTAVEYLNKKGSLSQGGSVGHMAIGLGILLGCNPIIHIGFDCAYNNDGLSHNKLGDAVGKINIKDGSLDWEVNDPNSILKKSKHQLGNVIYVDGYFGGKVPTNVGLASFITSMEMIFKSHPKIKFINSCEGGAKKKYSEQMSLKSALRKYAKRKINKKKIRPLLSLLPKDQIKKDIKEITTKLDYEITLFNKEMEACDKAIEFANRMLRIKNKKKLEELLNLNEKYAMEAQNIAKKSNLLQIHIYKTSREINSRELKVKGSNENLIKNKDDLKTRIKRSKMILTAAKKSAQKLKDIYFQVFKYININIKTNEPKMKIKPETWDELIENGNWARPLLESEYIMHNIPEHKQWCEASYTRSKCLEMKQECIQDGLKSADDFTKEIEYRNYIEKSKEVGKKKNFKAALKYIIKATKINNTEESLWGLATTLHHSGKFKQSIKYYNKLILRNPNSNRYKFELGQVWLTLDVTKGIKIIDEVQYSTEEFVDFNLRLAELSLGIGDKKEAKRYIKKYLEAYPHSTYGKEIYKKLVK